MHTGAGGEEVMTVILSLYQDPSEYVSRSGYTH